MKSMSGLSIPQKAVPEETKHSTVETKSSNNEMKKKKEQHFILS
jgi:hypothetical protein